MIFFKKNNKSENDNNITLYYSENNEFVNLLINRSKKYFLISFKSDDLLYSLDIKEHDKLEFIKQSKKIYNVESDNFNLFMSEFLSTLRIRKKLSLRIQEQIYYRINKELSKKTDNKFSSLSNYID